VAYGLDFSGSEKGPVAQSSEQSIEFMLHKCKGIPWPTGIMSASQEGLWYMEYWLLNSESLELKEMCLSSAEGTSLYASDF
jgi:hypothetical protein